MRLPAVAIAAALASGIAVGLTPAVAARAGSRSFLLGVFCAAVTSLLTALLLLKIDRIAAAGVASLACWIFLGAASVGVEQQPRRADHVLGLVEAGGLQLKTPLRFHGLLRDEPEKLPWGVGYEVELTGVEYREELIPASGGLRLSFSGSAEKQGLPELHSGDGVSFLTQAKLPQMYRDEGAFDRRGYLSQQGVDLVATLRAAALLEKTAYGRRGIGDQLARVRERLREEVDALFPGDAKVAGVARAMLLGDRNFVEREESADFQKTGAFHVLVVAGLHVGAIAVVLFWVGRRLRLARVWTISATLLLLFGYVCVVQQRTPVLRAALMAGIVVVSGIFFRKLELLNSAGLAAVVLLVARPLWLRDASFQLSFLAVGCIAGLAMPWLERTAQPYVRALRGWRDVTKDKVHIPLATQMRIDLRTVARFLQRKLPDWLANFCARGMVGSLALCFRVWELLVLTLVLQMGMLPLLAGEFHRITLAAPLANFAAVPLTSLIVPLGFLCLGCAAIFPALAKIVALPLSWLILALLRVVQWLGGVRQFSYRIPAPPVWVSVGFLVLLVLLVVSLRVEFSRRILVVGFLSVALAVGIVLVAVFPFSPRVEAGKLEVSILDVGQGDGLFVVTPGGKTVLIDGGGAFGGFPGHEQMRGSDPGEEAISPYLWSRGFKKIDVVALTHGHQDHLGGLTAVLNNFRVGRLWIGREVKNPGMVKLEALAAEKKIPVEYQARGRHFSMDGVEGEFLWPEMAEDARAAAAAAAKNNDSLVLRLQYGDRVLLLPGDAEKQAEHVMLSENTAVELHADVLKVGHHGSKNSTTEEFLDAVGPKVAVISAGEDNSYGHPSPELLARLRAAGARILRTDQDGAVRILTDGSGLEITCFIACPEPKQAAVATSRDAQAPDHDQDHQQ
jgi:competence protein ComEC